MLAGQCYALSWLLWLHCGYCSSGLQVKLLEVLERVDKEGFEFMFGRELTYTTVLSDQRMVELIPNGSNTAVRYEDRKEFIRLVQKARLEESKEQVTLSHLVGDHCLPEACPRMFLVKCTMVSVPVLIRAMVSNPFGGVLEPMEFRSKVTSSSMGNGGFIHSSDTGFLNEQGCISLGLCPISSGSLEHVLSSHMS